MLAVIYLKRSIDFHWSIPELYFVDHNIFNLNTVFRSTNVPWTQRKSEFFSIWLHWYMCIDKKLTYRFGCPSHLTIVSWWIILTIFLLCYRSENPKFVDALRHLESSPVCQSLAMHSFLMLPMQRITRLPLLVDAIYNRLNSTSPEYQSCKDALQTLNKVLNILILPNR